MKGIAIVTIFANGLTPSDMNEVAVQNLPCTSYGFLVSVVACGAVGVKVRFQGGKNIM